MHEKLLFYFSRRRDVILRRKFGHCSNYLAPLLPPPYPKSGQLVQLFSDVEIQDLKVSLELKILYMLYNILYICNLKNS